MSSSARFDPTDDAAWERSILDAVRGRYTALAPRLGSADRQRLEGHLERVRELEQRLGAMRRCGAPPIVNTTGYDPASGLNSADDGSIRDLTHRHHDPDRRQIHDGHAGDGIRLRSHHVRRPSMDGQRGQTHVSLARPRRTPSFLHERRRVPPGRVHAYLHGGIRSSTPTSSKRSLPFNTGGHSLLDESVVFFGSNIQHPATHSKADMPFLLAGNGGGLRTGRYLQLPPRLAQRSTRQFAQPVRRSTHDVRHPDVVQRSARRSDAARACRYAATVAGAFSCVIGWSRDFKNSITSGSDRSGAPGRCTNARASRR